MKNVNDPDFWEDIYKRNDIGWDLNGPTPIFNKIANKLKPGRVIILGSGRGHDAIIFSKLNFEVTAVDFAPSAINYLEKLCKKNNVKVNAVQSDIFSLGKYYDNYFDYIIEQTCFCAIDPKRREEYERLVFRILNSAGNLIGLWYPLDKAIEDGGPPWGVSRSNLKNIFEKRWIVTKELFSELSVKKRKQREKLIIFKKKQ